MKHLTTTRSYTDFNTLLENEPEAIQSLINQINKYNNTQNDKLIQWNWETDKYEPMDNIEDLIQLIRECGDSNEYTDSNYIYNDYILETEGFEFTVTGSSYRKDQSICDQEMGDNITVVDLNMLKEEKAKIKEQNQHKNIDKWNNWFENKTIEEIKESLLTINFPAKLK